MQDLMMQDIAGKEEELREAHEELRVSRDKLQEAVDANKVLMAQAKGQRTEAHNEEISALQEALQSTRQELDNAQKNNQKWQEYGAQGVRAQEEAVALREQLSEQVALVAALKAKEKDTSMEKSRSEAVMASKSNEAVGVQGDNEVQAVRKEIEALQRTLQREQARRLELENHMEKCSPEKVHQLESLLEDERTLRVQAEGKDMLLDGRKAMTVADVESGILESDGMEADAHKPESGAKRCMAMVKYAWRGSSELREQSIAFLFQHKWGVAHALWMYVIALHLLVYVALQRCW